MDPGSEAGMTEMRDGNNKERSHPAFIEARQELWRLASPSSEGEGKTFELVIPGWFLIKPARESTRANEALVLSRRA